MKHNLFHTLTLIMVALCTAFAATGCDNDSPADVPTAGYGPHVYTLKLLADRPTFDGAHRARLTWDDGAQVYLRLTDGATDVIAIATYSATTDTWQVVAQKPLSGTQGNCQAYYFENPTAMSAAAVTLTTASVTYADTLAAYEVNEDLLAVRAHMTPLTGRLRLRGEAGRTFGVSGLATLTKYQVVAGTFVTTAQKLQGTVGSDGYSDYYHVRFAADDAALVVDYNATACFRRAFTPDVLAAGTSGFITLPTAAAPGAWTLVNRQNMQPITLPVLGAVTADPIHSTSVVLTIPVLSSGNGTLAQPVAYLSQQPNPTAANSTAVEGTLSDGTLTFRAKGLTPTTPYYVRIMVSNEKGTAQSAIILFTTLSKEEDGSSMDRDDFGDDNDLDGDKDSNGEIDRDDFDGDDNLDDDKNTGGDIDRDDFDDDDNLDDDKNTGGAIDRDDFKDDDNLDDDKNTGGAIDRDDFKDDDNLDDNKNTGGNIDRDDFGEDEDLN